jgi:hypothetical protein
MKIAFFSENGFMGTAGRDYAHMRTEMAWICALKGDHHHLSSTNKYEKSPLVNNFDLHNINLKAIRRKIKVPYEQNTSDRGFRHGR